MKRYVRTSCTFHSSSTFVSPCYNYTFFGAISIYLHAFPFYDGKQLFFILCLLISWDSKSVISHSILFHFRVSLTSSVFFSFFFDFLRGRWNRTIANMFDASIIYCGKSNRIYSLTISIHIHTCPDLTGPFFLYL